MRPLTSRRVLGGPLALVTLVSGLVVATPQRALADAPETSVNQLDVPAASGTVEGQSVIAALPATSGSFDLVGLTWRTLPAGADVQVRTEGSSGWSEWTSLETTQSASTAEAGRSGTEPTYVGASTRVEARVLGQAGQQVSGLRLSLVDSTQVAADTGLPTSGTKFSASASGYTYPTRPTVITRAQWGADEGMLSYNGSDCVPANLDSTVKAAVVHHTAGSNSYTKDQSASIVRGIYAYHVKSMGWCDVGYNFLVDKYGQVFEGRHGGMFNAVHGAHATSWNTDTVGVSVMMDSSKAVQSEAAMTAVTNVLAWKLAGNYRDPNTKLTLAGKYVNRIMRHGDVMSTACPGTNITAYMPTLRQRVTTAMGNWKTPIYQKWVAKGGESGTFGAPYTMERSFTGGRVTDFAGGDIYQQSSTGQTFALAGSTAERYQSMGRTTSWLGWPVADQAAGAAAGQTITQFTGGRIYASPSTGAQAVPAALASWLDANPSIAQTLGYPTGAAVNPTGDTGSQTFAGGRVTWSGGRYALAQGSGKMGDLDGNSRADLVSVQSSGSLRWFPTSSKGTSNAAVTGTGLGGTYNWVGQVPDLDGDRNNELLARRSDGTLWLWRGLGQGTYTAKKQVGTGWQNNRELSVSPDMDGDGVPEVVAINGKNQLVRYTLSKDLRITKVTVVGGDFSGLTRLSALADFRGTGRVDVLGIDAEGKLWAKHTTTGGGLVGDRQLAGWGWGGLVRVRSLGDVDGDGRWDLVATGRTGAVKVYSNQTVGLRTATNLMSSNTGLGVMG